MSNSSQCVDAFQVFCETNPCDTETGAAGTSPGGSSSSSCAFSPGDERIAHGTAAAAIGSLGLLAFGARRRRPASQKRSITNTTESR
jgi:hypothetical protein